MTGKQTEVKESKNVVDLVWKGWLNNFHTYDALQQDMEEKSLQLLDKQKDALEATRQALDKIEKQSGKMTTELKSNYQTPPELTNPVLSSWFNLVEDASDKIQTFTWNPSRSMLDYYSKTQEKMTENYEESLRTQREGRKEAIQSLESFAEQMKDAHKKLLASIGN